MSGWLEKDVENDRNTRLLCRVAICAAILYFGDTRLDRLILHQVQDFVENQIAILIGIEDFERKAMLANFVINVMDRSAIR